MEKSELQRMFEYASVHENSSSKESIIEENSWDDLIDDILALEKQDYKSKLLKKQLMTFFEWYKKSPFSSSGKTEDLIDMYMGNWTPTVSNTQAGGV